MAVFGAAEIISGSPGKRAPLLRERDVLSLRPLPQGAPFSPLDTIDAGNVERLGLAWEFHTGTLRALEATPLVVDGVMYVTTTWSRVAALDARSGEPIWQYDPVVKGVFGALRDASPDYWGRRVIEKRSGLVQLEEIDYLLQSPDDRAGALGFGLNPEPPAPLRTFNRTLDLEHLQTLADRIIADEELPPENPDAAAAEDLLLLGTSMGGARPKVVVADDNALWIAKFNRTDDPWNHARVEHVMLELARECDIASAESRVFQVGDRDVLLVKRFDREPHPDGGFRRARMLSALTLLRAGDGHQDRDLWSYVLLAEDLRRVSRRPDDDGRELFRRMVFNALISNTDDHPRNHAIIALEDDWRLSRAYDLTPFPAVSEERRDLALTAGIHGRYANATNLRSQCEHFRVSDEEASRIIDRMAARVRARWEPIARREGVSEPDCYRISRAFVYPGFRLEPGQG